MLMLNWSLYHLWKSFGFVCWFGTNITVIASDCKCFIESNFVRMWSKKTHGILKTRMLTFCLFCTCPSNKKSLKGYIQPEDCFLIFPIRWNFEQSGHSGTTFQFTEIWYYETVFFPYDIVLFAWSLWSIGCH